MGYALSRVYRVVVFPYTDDFPSRLLETSVGVEVTTTIIRDFIVPEGGRSTLGRTVVFITTVPEAAIEENSDLLFGKDEVGGAANILDRSSVHTVSEAESVYG